MEALIVVVAELAAVFVTAALIVAVLVSAGALAGILTATLGRRPARKGVGQLRRLLVVAFAVAALLLLALQTVALRPLLNWGLGGLAASRGYAVSIADAELSLLRGGLIVRDLRLTRGASVALRVRRIELDLEWPSLARERLELQHLEIEGVLGRFAPTKTRASASAGARASAASSSRRFVAETLLLRDLDLVVASDVDPLGHHLRVERLQVAPLRSDHLLYDLILRAQGLLKLDDVTIRADHADGEIHWRVRGIPSAKVAHRLGPAFAGLREGTVDVDLGAPLSPQPGAADETSLTLGLRLHGARALPPADSTARQRLAATALNLALRARDPLEIELRLPIRARDFVGALTLADAGLERAATRSLVDAVIRSARVRASPP